MRFLRSACRTRYKADLLALAAAQAVNVIKSDALLVEGNHVDPKDAPPVVHYAKEGGTPNGYSLGDLDHGEGRASERSALVLAGSLGQRGEVHRRRDAVAERLVRALVVEEGEVAADAVARVVERRGRSPTRLIKRMSRCTRLRLTSWPRSRSLASGPVFGVHLSGSTTKRSDEAGRASRTAASASGNTRDDGGPLDHRHFRDRALRMGTRLLTHREHPAIASRLVDHGGRDNGHPDPQRIECRSDASGMDGLDARNSSGQRH